MGNCTQRICLAEPHGPQRLTDPMDVLASKPRTMRSPSHCRQVRDIERGSGNPCKYRGWTDGESAELAV